MEPQDPAPPPNPELLNRQPKWFKMAFHSIIIASILFVLAVAILSTLPFRRSHGRPHQTQALSNLRQIGLALYEFEKEYGQYPSPATIPLVKANHPMHTFNLSGNSSNALFRQLFAAELTQSEQMFYAKIENSRKPDGNFSGAEALKKGEVAFGYISGLSIKGNPARPIAFAPIIPGTTRFDPKPFDGKAVILRLDNSVVSVNIDPAGHAILGTTDMLSPTNPIWGTEGIPKIHYPE